MEFIKRDVQDWEKKRHEPQDPKNWHKVYKRLVRESQSQINKDAQRMKATIDDIKNEKSKNTIKRVELDFVKLPEDMKRSGPTISLNNKIRFIDRGASRGNPNDKPPSQREIRINRGELDPDAPIRTAKPKTKLGFLRNNATGTPRFQQQPKKPSGIITAREMALKQKPTNTSITQAPRSMIEEHRRAAIPKPFDPSVAPAPAANPRKRKVEYEESPQPTTSTRMEKRQENTTNSSSTPQDGPVIKAPRFRAPALKEPSPTLFPSSNMIQSLQKRSPSLSPPQSSAPSSSSSPSKAVNRGLPTSQAGRSRANTSSPNHGATLPPKIMKRKAPADIFMRPKKKPKARAS